MEDEIKDFRKEIKEYEDRLLKMGFNLNETKTKKDWLYLEYKMENEKYYINVSIYKDKKNNKVWANIVPLKPEEYLYYKISLDEMLSILENYFKQNF